MHKSRSQLIPCHTSRVEKRAVALESQKWFLFLSLPGIDCGMCCFMTLGKSPHHFSVTPLSCVIKGTFYLTNPVNLSICKSLLSVTFKTIYTFGFQTETYAFGWTPMGNARRVGSPQLCVSWKPQQLQWVLVFFSEVEDENPQGQQFPGESQLPVREKQPWSHPGWTSAMQDWHDSSASNSTQVYGSSRTE